LNASSVNFETLFCTPEATLENLPHTELRLSPMYSDHIADSCAQIKYGTGSWLFKKHSVLRIYVNAPLLADWAVMVLHWQESIPRILSGSGINCQKQSCSYLVGWYVEKQLRRSSVWLPGRANAATYGSSMA
jgi:hypothetical protein